MINYALFCELGKFIGKIPALTGKLYMTGGTFYAAVLELLRELQGFAETHKLYIASDIAIETDKLYLYSGSGSEGGRKNLRKEKDAFALSCLNSVNKFVKEFLEKDRKSIEECRDIWRQVLSRALQKGVKIPDIQKADAIMAAVKSDPELAPYYSHITGLLGIYNAKAVLDITLPELGL